MSIRRQYSLPNCTLILEGYPDANASIPQIDPRPLMSILINAECRFMGQEQKLSGGRDFFESLVTVVSDYAQEFLSGVSRPIPTAEQDKPAVVELHRVNNYQHRLSVQRTEANQTANELNLTTVQLFDLVEAVDQFLADSRTLPDLSLTLAPVPKRYARSDQPVAQRAVPVALGVGGLALAAMAFFFVPIPEVQKPEKDPTPRPQASSQPTPTPVASADPPSPSASLSPSPSPTPSPKPQPADLEKLLTTAPEITDPTQLRTLQKDVYDKIAEPWTPERRGFGTKLEYRVGVSADGAIMGAKAVNDAANRFYKETPLPDLLYIPAPGSEIGKEPIAQFRVVFTKAGVLQVSPWLGYNGEPTLGPEITERAILRDLNDKLYNQIRENWGGSPSYKRNLEFRVSLTKEGVIANYEPENQPAYDYVKETPLPNLAQNTGSAGEEEPLAHFRVVFKPSGVLEVSPVRGFR